MPVPARSPQPESVRAQVRLITSSQLFSQSDRLKQFLEYVTERTLSGRGDELKESLLALEVFGRLERREGGADSLVRVTASKVRSKLKEYYLSDGSQDAILIELPKGTYVPVFQDRTQPSKTRLPFRWILVVAATISIVSATAIGARFGSNPGVQKPDGTDPVTQGLYVRARHYANQFTGTGRLKSFDLLREAIRRDPRFVPAYVTLAETHLTPPQLRPPWEEASEARVLLAKALELAPQSQDALTMMGILKFNYDRDWPAAEKYFRRAIALGPDSTTPHYRLGEALAYIGRTDEAIRELELVLRKDPVSDRALPVITCANYLARRFDRALEAAKRQLDMYPTSRAAHLFLGIIHDGSGDPKEGIKALERLLAIHKDPAPIGYLGALGHAYAAAGRPDDALRLLHQLENTPEVWVSPVFMARICVGLGMNERALDLLESAFGQHDPNVVWLKLDPRMDPLRKQTRYKELLKRLSF